MQERDDIMLTLSDDTYFTYKEIADLLNCTTHYVKDLITAKKLISNKVTTRNIKHISLTNLMKYLDTTKLEENGKEAIKLKALNLANESKNTSERNNLDIDIISTIAQKSEELDKIEDKELRLKIAKEFIDILLSTLPIDEIDKQKLNETWDSIVNGKT